MWTALRNYNTGKADFADFLLGEVNRLQGCDYTVTFDKQAARSDSFVLLS